MILIITHKTDYTVDFVINKLNKQNIPYRRFNCEDILASDLSIHFSKKIEYSILGKSHFNSVWFRRTQLPEINGLSGGEKLYVLNEIDSLIKNLLSILDVKWLSKPMHVYNAENKLLQLKIAQEIGFEIPPTVITTSKEELRKFYKENEENIIIKPIAHTRIDDANNASFIFTNEVLESHIKNLDQYDLTPCIFQRNIAKQYEVRVTVVGDKVFAAAVNSQNETDTKTDWRKLKLPFYKIELPGDVKDKCVEIVKLLGLEFGAIDLIKDNNGNYVFLEINPNGQWVWIENDTGLEISNAIIENLLN